MINSSSSNTMILIWNLDLGHLISTLSYLATPIPKTCRFMITFSWLMKDYPRSLFSLSTWSIFWSGWVKGIILRLFYSWYFSAGSTPSWLKVIGGGVGVGGPCDYCVSPSPNNCIFGFFRLGLNLGSGFGACWDR